MSPTQPRVRPSSTVLLISRPSADRLPPTLYQAAILSEQGFHVILADESLATEESSNLLPFAVVRHRLGGPSPPASAIQRFCRAIQFRRSVRQLIARARPGLIIAYDVESCQAVGQLRCRPGSRVLWHLHELPDPETRSLSARLANRFVWRSWAAADVIVLPDPGRAKAFAARAGLPVASIAVVANCPRLLTTVPVGKLRDALPRRVPATAPVVLYHGAIGPHHGLELAIASLPRWRANAVFVVKGRVSPGYSERLVRLAVEAGVKERLVILDRDRDPTAEHFAIIAGADLGWTVLEHVSDNWRHSALASNKRFECMALGVPQVSDDGPGLRDLIETGGCGLCIEPSSSSAAESVNRLLGDVALRHRMAARGREMHLRLYNYEAQFEKILNWIRSSPDPAVGSVLSTGSQIA